MVKKYNKSSFSVISGAGSPTNNASLNNAMADWWKNNNGGEVAPTNDPTKVDPGNCFSDNMLKRYNTSLQVMEKSCIPDNSGLYQETGFYAPAEYNNTLFPQSCNPPTLPYTYLKDDCKLDPASSVGYSTSIIKNGSTTIDTNGLTGYICYPAGYPKNGSGDSNCYGSIKENDIELNSKKLEYFESNKNKVFSIVKSPVYTQPPRTAAPTTTASVNLAASRTTAAPTTAAPTTAAPTTAAPTTAAPTTRAPTTAPPTTTALISNVSVSTKSSNSILKLLEDNKLIILVIFLILFSFIYFNKKRLKK